MRELRNVVERGVSLDGDYLDVPGADVGATTNESEIAITPSGVVFQPTAHLKFKDAKEQLLLTFEVAYLRYLLARSDGNLTRAAQEAGLDRNYVRRLVKKHGLLAK